MHFLLFLDGLKSRCSAVLIPSLHIFSFSGFLDCWNSWFRDFLGSRFLDCEGERAGEDGRKEQEKKTSARMTQAGENIIEIRLTARVRKERQAMKAKTKQKRGRRATHRQRRREDREETKNLEYQASN